MKVATHRLCNQACLGEDSKNSTTFGSVFPANCSFLSIQCCKVVRGILYFLARACCDSLVDSSRILACKDRSMMQYFLGFFSVVWDNSCMACSSILFVAEKNLLDKPVFLNHYFF